jgi:hypothetical protein
MEKKIFRVEAHDTTDVEYPCASPMLFLAEDVHQLRADIERDNEGLIEIDDISEISLEEVIRLFNLYVA